MKNIEKELEKMSDRQHYIHDDVRDLLKRFEKTTNQIMEVLDRIVSKIENEE